MDAAKKQRECALGQFTRFEKKLKGALKAGTNPWALEKIYEDLRIRFRATEEAHDAYVIQIESPDGSEEDWIQNVIDRFDQLEIEVGEKFNTMNPNRPVGLLEKEKYVPQASSHNLNEIEGESMPTHSDIDRDHAESNTLRFSGMHLGQNESQATVGSGPFDPKGIFQPSKLSYQREDGGLLATQISNLSLENTTGALSTSLSTRKRESPMVGIPKEGGSSNAGISGPLKNRPVFDVPPGYSMLRQKGGDYSGAPVNRPHEIFPSEPHSKDSYLRNSLNNPDYLSHSSGRQEMRSGGYNLYTAGNMKYFTGAVRGDAQPLENQDGRTNSRNTQVGLARLNPIDRASSRGGSAIRIEKMKFENFNGDIREYPEFRYEFITFIEPQCEDYLLAYVLKKHLASSVQDEISNAMGNYLLMWQRLDKRYGNVGRLIDTILYEVKNLSSSYETSDGIMQMIKIVEKAARDLDRLNLRSELHNATTISIIEQAMSTQMKHEWVRLVSVDGCNSQVKFEALLEFLSDWKSRLEYLDANIRGTPTYQEGGSYHAAGQKRANEISNQRQMEGEKEKEKEKPSESRNAQRRIRCWLHNVDGDEGAHAIWKCSLFMEKTVKERQNLVKINNACQRCLEIGCPGVKELSKCKRNFKCVLAGCGGNHNRLIHSKDGTVLHAREDLSTTGEAILPVQTL